MALLFFEDTPTSKPEILQFLILTFVAEFNSMAVDKNI